ncbi:MAG: hypothetical protein AVDCRST_MAG66-2917, partial [uncultured Pseudonocardia sp.]
CSTRRCRRPAPPWTGSCASGWRPASPRAGPG